MVFFPVVSIFHLQSSQFRRCVVEVIVEGYFLKPDEVGFNTIGTGELKVEVVVFKTPWSSTPKIGTPLFVFQNEENGTLRKFSDSFGVVNRRYDVPVDGSEIPNNHLVSMKPWFNRVEPWFSSKSYCTSSKSEILKMHRGEKAVDFNEFFPPNLGPDDPIGPPISW